MTVRGVRLLSFHKNFCLKQCTVSGHCSQTLQAYTQKSFWIHHSIFICLYDSHIHTFSHDQNPDFLKNSKSLPEFILYSILWSSYILRRPQNFAKSPPIIWLALHWTNNSWWFRKILWPSQNIWTLKTFMYQLHDGIIFMIFSRMLLRLYCNSA